MTRTSFLLTTMAACLFAGCGGSPVEPTAQRSRSLEVAGAPPAIGGSTQWTATATLSGSTTQVVTTEARWESSDPAVATVRGGMVTGIAPGEADIIARYGDVSGRSHVTVASTPCEATVSPATLSFPAAGGTRVISVYVGKDCAWDAQSSVPFVSMLDASGSGIGAFSVSVPVNTGEARTATLTSAGRQVTVTQAGTQCVTAVSPTTAAYSAGIQQGVVTVTAPADCRWTVTASPFIQFPDVYSMPVTAGPSGTGNGSFTYRVLGNLTGAPRSGTIDLLARAVTITQRAPSGGNSLSFVSESDDYIGRGWTALYEDPAWTFTVDRASSNQIDLAFMGSDVAGLAWWNLSLMVPPGQLLAPGRYTGATRYALHMQDRPGLSFSGSGRGCSQATGEFTIIAIAFGGDGLLQHLRASFEQHCEGAVPALRGNVSYTR